MLEVAEFAVSSEIVVESTILMGDDVFLFSVNRQTRVECETSQRVHEIA